MDGVALAEIRDAERGEAEPPIAHGEVKFYSSPNGTTWTLVARSNTTPVLIQNAWYSTTSTPNVDLPSGTIYLKVEFSDTAYAYSPQLGQISVMPN